MADLITVLLYIGVIFLISLGSQLLNYKLINQKALRSFRSESNKLRKEMLSLRDKPQEMLKVQNKLMEVNMGMMKLTMKPMIYTMLPFLFILWGLGYFYGGVGDMIPLPYELPIVGNALGWLGTYVLFSLVFSTVLKPLVTRVGDKFAKEKPENN